MTLRLTVSRSLAILLGVVIPVLEVLRRWGTWWQYPPAFLDDFLLGGFLLVGAWATRPSVNEHGRSVLASAWAFALGMIYCSASVHHQALIRGEPDPAPIPSSWVLAVKLVGLAVTLGAMLLSLLPDRQSEPPSGSPAT